MTQARFIGAALSGVAIAATAFADNHAERADAGVMATVDALYDVISGPAGEERDWDRFRSLFAEGAQMGVTRPGEDGWTVARFTPAEYVERSGAWLVENGFFETAIHNEIDVFGGIAHVFSTYEGTRTEAGEVFLSGINSIQLVRTGDAWKVQSIFWMQASDEHPIPEGYLPAADDASAEGGSASEDPGSKEEEE